MFDANAKPLDLCKWFVPHLARAMSMTDSDELDQTYECGAFTISIKGRNDDKDGDPNIPRKVRRTAEKVQDVFRAFEAIWRTPGRGVSPVMPKDVITWLKAEYERIEPDKAKRKDAPRSSVHHALTDLQDLGFVYQHADGGWMRGPRPVRQQGSILGEESVPNAIGTPSPLAEPATVANASPVEREKGSPPTPKGESMRDSKRIWVPGEKDEFGTDGLIVTDTSGTTHLAEGAQERIRYVGRTGRPVASFAICAELISVEDEGRYQVATVKVRTPEGRKQIRVKVVGDWQLTGRMSDREKMGEVSASN